MGVEAKEAETMDFRALRWWPIWCGYWLARLLVQLPFPVLMVLGRGLGRLLYLSLPERRHIVEVNLRLCFPELSEAQRQCLKKRIFIANGVGFIESLLAWWGPKDKLAGRVRFEGLEHLQAAKAEGRGVLLLGAHFSTLELGGLFMSQLELPDALYRPHDNPLLEKLITRGRSRFCGNIIERSDFRRVLRCLKQNHCVWYAPDQDLGKHSDVFAPFFGQQAASVTITSRLARLSKAPVIMYSHHRDADDRGYTVRFQPPLADFPSGDDVADAARINKVIEEAVRRCPEQYLWLHKRFKTQPDGRHKLYK